MKIELREEKLVVTDFNELEAYKIAAQIERDGIAFYGQLITTLTDTDRRDKIEFLLREEEKHLAFFEKRIDIVREAIDDGFEDDDLTSYMDYGIFNHTADRIADKVKDADEALVYGITAEEKSIQFYTACRQQVSDESVKTELNTIITEELKHKALLENLQ